jgi:hypothetical protein
MSKPNSSTFCFFDIKEIICYEFAPQKWSAKHFTFNSFNVYSVNKVQILCWASKFCSRKEVPVLEHPLCSHDLAPYDFLFSEVKMSLKGFF